MKKIFKQLVGLSLLLTGCATSAPVMPPQQLMAQQNPARMQTMSSANEDLTTRILRNIYKENLDDLDNGRPAEVINMPRGGFIFEGLTAVGFVRPALYLLSDKIIKKEFNKPGVPDNVPRIDDAGLKAMIAHLQPGDIVLCGNNDSFVHSFVYLGNNEIIHALAQLDAKGNFMGVIRETLTGYIQRIHRDKFVVLRKPGMTPADVEKMRAYQTAQIGKSYDSLFLINTEDRFYCTELVWQALRRVSQPPRVYPHRAKYGWDLIKNEDYMDSPDLQTVWTYNYTRPATGLRHRYQ
ncbi:MAG: YiiX/YebB-like N1pC/P60 family cysteine hydrolase [Candidatus Sericytochromatia bacterium]